MTDNLSYSRIAFKPWNSEILWITVEPARMFSYCHIMSHQHFVSETRLWPCCDAGHAVMQTSVTQSPCPLQIFADSLGIVSQTFFMNTPDCRKIFFYNKHSGSECRVTFIWSRFARENDAKTRGAESLGENTHRWNTLDLFSGIWEMGLYTIYTYFLKALRGLAWRFTVYVLKRSPLPVFQGKMWSTQTVCDLNGWLIWKEGIQTDRVFQGRKRPPPLFFV